MILVVDASVAVKWYLSEDHTDAAEKLLDGGFDLHAPELIFTELGNVLKSIG
jgi:predicted nucleic acid-binding protein